MTEAGHKHAKLMEELTRLRAMEATLLEMKKSVYLQYRKTYYHFFEREEAE